VISSHVCDKPILAKGKEGNYKRIKVPAFFLAIYTKLNIANPEVFTLKISQIFAPFSHKNPKP
jgi:hypothetical protein